MKDCKKKQMPALSDSFRITLFCSANADIDSHYFSMASKFALAMASRGWQLVYGGSRTGLMGHFADETLKAGGVVRGAITTDLASQGETPHQGLHELVLVEDLFERKRWLMNEADVFVVFPGGFGTLDEALEAITWKALGCHSKPILFFNLGGFWQNQIQVFQDLQSQGMIRTGGLALYEVCDSHNELWSRLDDLQRSSEKV